MIQEAVAMAIRELWAERGTRLYELAGAAGLDRSNLSHLLNDPGNPSWGTLRRVAAALDVPLSELFRRAEKLARNGVGGAAVAKDPGK